MASNNVALKLNKPAKYMLVYVVILGLIYMILRHEENQKPESEQKSVLKSLNVFAILGAIGMIMIYNLRKN